MNQLNNILLEGTIVQDPEVAATSISTKARLIKFTLANDRYWRDRTGVMQQDTLFIPIKCWGELGERCLERIKKGMAVRILGRLRMCKWETKKGEKRTSMEVVCTHLEYRPLSKGQSGQVEIIEDEGDESDMLSDFTVLYEF
ncbi:MAG: single-stranded DNA-binding protein [Candidatus Ornithospirochaeta sp.]